MPIRRRPSARAVTAAAICASLTALGAGPASSTTSETNARIKTAARADGPAPSASPQPEQTDRQSTAPTRQQPARHTVVPGDTLWDIAQQTLGSPPRWEEIYTLNQQTIEDDARRHGYASSGRGHWIFPGTVLTLPNGGAASGATAARSALRKLQANIADYVAGNNTYTFGNHLDPDTRRIVLDTDAPASVVSQLTDLASATEGELQAIRNMQVNRKTVVDTQSRQDDASPFSGGAGIKGAESGCTSGYTVEDSDEQRFMVTAGHCFPNGTTVETFSGNQTVGTVSGRRFHKCFDYPGLDLCPGQEQKDMALIGGKDYRGRLYIGEENSTTTIPVAGAGDANVGDIICYSGLATGENCGGTVTDTEAQVCPKGNFPSLDLFFVHCTYPATYFKGGTQNVDGDSGAPLYAKDELGRALIRGHVIGGPNSGPSEGYAEPWREVASTYGVHIVTDELD